MKKMIGIILLAILFQVNQVQAVLNAEWTTGHHIVQDGDEYGEVWMRNDATAEVLGGVIGKLETWNFSSADIFGGEMSWFFTFDNTVVNIYGGSLDWLGAWDNSSVNLYAYDVTYHLTGGLEDRPWLEGTYYSNNSSFSFTLYDEYSYPYVKIVPEPATFSLLALSSLALLRKRRIE